MTNQILKLENINKKMSEYFSLININLEIERGKVHAIIGENGSGKTTLMNIITGKISKDSGNVYLNGSLVNINSATDSKKHGIVMTHQESNLIEHLSVAENVFFTTDILSGFFLKTINWTKLYGDTKNLFKKLGINIEIDIKKQVRSLENAQKQLVEIAKAYVSNAEIIIMDEPTSSFTETETKILFNIIKELKNKGTAIIYISHRLEEIKQFCDKITVMRMGRCVGTIERSELETINLINMMTGMELKERYPKLNLKKGQEVLRIAGLTSGTVLKNINFSLNSKEIIGITGLAGSGKSIIAKSIFGMNKIDTGDIFINKKKVKIRSPLDAIKEGLGYVPEERQIDGLFMYLKIFENMTASSIDRFTTTYIIDKKKELNISSAFVEKLGIKIGSLDNKVENLSGGNQQKVILAKWMMSKSKIFILDEPTRGIDIASKVDVYNLMNDLIRKNSSIILISSDIEELIGMCDRILVLYGGLIVVNLPKEEATKNKIMYYATGCNGEFDEHRH
jgi:ABC-type sugar transport system ATPase subunit